MANELFNLNNFDLYLASPFLLLIIGAIFILVVGCFKSYTRRFFSVCALIFIAISLVLSFVFNFHILKAQYSFFDTYVSDGYSFFAQIIILIFSALYLLAEKNEVKFEYYSLFLFMIASLVLMVSSTNLIMIFLALEASSLALFTIIALKSSKNAVSSALKYFSMAAFGSGFFVLASALLYYKNGSLQLDVVYKMSFINEPILLASGVLFLVILGIKLSIMPFHFWLKPVYYASNPTLIAFISVVPKIAILVVALRIFVSFNLGLDFELVLATIAMASLLVASVLALGENNLKKMFAYSSVSHSAFALAAIISIVSALDGRIFDLEFMSMLSLFFYWFVFAFANFGVFIILNLFKEHNYEDFSGLYEKHPVLSIFLAIFILSLAGIPPFGVFWGKSLILVSVLSENHIFLGISMALSSAIILYAYLKVLIQIFFKKANNTVILSVLYWPQKLALGICLFASIFAIIFLV